MTDRARTPVLGVDGARGGWVGVIWDGHGPPQVLFDQSLAHLVDAADSVTPATELAVISVDMPIELEAAATRACDDEVRPLLGPRRSSLFAAPPLGSLDCDTYAAANASSRASTGRGLSKQAWMLAPKIREVRAVVAAGETRMHETFPELSFAAMTGAPMPHAKRTWNGLLARIRALAEAGIRLPDDAGPAGGVAPDDLVDAAACAWSARRIRDGQSQCRPDPPGGRPAIHW